MMFALIAILPLIIAAFLALLFRNNGSLVKYAAFAASVASLMLIIYLYLSISGWSSLQGFQWFSLGSISFNISIATAPINMFLLLLVGIMTPLIFLYSIGFMDTQSQQARFYFEMSIFAAAMMLFAISASLITMFIAWEMLGITSYLLIGFWYWKEKPPAAARKAITTILIGDMLMLAGILFIGVTYGTFEFSALFSAAPTPALDAALLLILLAAFTKSAQFPFHEWLPDAMEGPTPVSAFLHSSTMVKAGVFLIAVLFPLYVSAGLLPVILIFGLISAILGVSNALAERHIKKILAYSTIEDLGLMFVALGLGSLLGAMLLFFVQTFYKGLLFMGAGSLMRANDEREDIFTNYSSATNKLIFIPIVIGALSMAGVFPLSGVFGKSAIAGVAEDTNVLAYAVIVLLGLGSSIYIFRWLFIPMSKPFKNEKQVEVNYRTIPKTMIAAAIILAILVIAAPIFNTYPSLLTLELSSGSPIPISEMAEVSVIALVGLAIAYRVYRQGHQLHVASANRPLYIAFYNSIIVNGFYMYLTKAVAIAADGLGYFDLKLDKLTYSASSAMLSVGSALRKIVNGQTNVYVAAFVIGIVLLLALFIW
ncbi:MAG: NADH-quinone oxidoreductase subunit L [Candidatus Micrarchaeales archaeon]|nr:NADH-quinone oxidoreductase subunit L [Candidatus Micrarchaeales archaeon]